MRQRSYLRGKTAAALPLNFGIARRNSRGGVARRDSPLRGVAVIRGLVLLSMKFRVLVVGAAVLVLGLGITQVRNASVDVLPEFAPPQVEIQAEALGLSAAEVEQLITVPLEQAMVRLMPAGDDQGKIIARGFPGGAVSPQSFSQRGVAKHQPLDPSAAKVDLGLRLVARASQPDHRAEAPRVVRDAITRL